MKIKEMRQVEKGRERKQIHRIGHEEGKVKRLGKRRQGGEKDRKGKRRDGDGKERKWQETK